MLVRLVAPRRRLAGAAIGGTSAAAGRLSLGAVAAPCDCRRGALDVVLDAARAARDVTLRAWLGGASRGLQRLVAALGRDRRGPGGPPAPRGGLPGARRWRADAPPRRGVRRRAGGRRA